MKISKRLVEAALAIIIFLAMYSCADSAILRNKDVISENEDRAIWVLEEASCSKELLDTRPGMLNSVSEYIRKRNGNYLFSATTEEYTLISMNEGGDEECKIIERILAMYAWPAEINKTGRRCFALLVDGSIWQSEDAGYSGYENSPTFKFSEKEDELVFEKDTTWKKIK